MSSWALTIPSTCWKTIRSDTLRPSKASMKKRAPRSLAATRRKCCECRSRHRQRLTEGGLRVIEERKRGWHVSRGHPDLIAFVRKQNSANQQSAQEGRNKRQSQAPTTRRRSRAHSPQLLIQ